MPNNHQKTQAILALPGLHQVAEEKNFRQGEFIFKEGTDDPHFYLVEEGEIEILLRESTGNEKVIAYVKAGELLGEGTLSGKTLKPASARAATAVKLLALSYDNFQKLAKDVPQDAIQFLLNVLGIVNGRLSRTNVKLLALFELSAMMSAYRDDLKGMCNRLLQQLLTLMGAKDGALLLKNPFSSHFRTMASTSATLNEDTLKDFDFSKSYAMSDKRGYFLIANLQESGVLVFIRPDKPFEYDQVKLVSLIADQAARIIEETSRRAEEKAKNILHQKRYVL